MAAETQGAAWHIEPVATGVPNLDRLLDGGLTRGGLVLVVGGPGTGKTVLSEQMSFHWAAHGRPVLWVVTPGEPNEKLLTHLSQMRFFDRSLVGSALQLINMSRYLEQGGEAMMGVIRKTVQAGDYALVVIDGFQNLHPFVGGEQDVRLFLSELSSELALMGITLIVTADAAPERYWESAEFTMADAILELERVTVEGYEQRYISVLKQRGRDSIGGAHSFRIDSAGLYIHPRIEAVLSAGDAPATTVRHAFGLAGLDQMLAGGLLEGSTTLVAGAPGTGKTLLASQFLAEGLRQGQCGLYVGFFESLNCLLARADEFGMPLRKAHETGLLQMKLYPSGRCDPDACAEEVLAIAEERGVRRLVFDGLEPVERELAPGGRVMAYLTTIVEYLRWHGVTTVATRELPDALGPTASLTHPLIGQVAANLIWLRFARTDTRRHRLLSVLKTRYSDHSDAIGELLLAEGRLDVISDPAAVHQEKPGLVPVAFEGEPQAGHYH